MMRQYLGFKNKHQDAILLFRMGDFYELFFDDAKIAARVLGIALTSREKGENAAPMAGFPCHSAENYIKRLIEAGHRVAVCEQVEDPSSANGLVERDIVRVITPGTLTEEDILDRNSNNFLAAISKQNDLYGLAWVDLSTGDFEVEEVNEGSLGDSLRRINPSECLLPEVNMEENDSHPALTELSEECLVTSRPPWEFSTDEGYRTLTEHFGTATLDGFGCEDMEAAIGAGGALMAYLEETQRGAIRHITRITPFNPGDYLFLDRTTQRSLELVETIRGSKREGTLLDILDKTITPPGARLLKRWLLTPLKRKENIKSRLDAVSELVERTALRKELSEGLKNVYDIERLATKISTGRANARDVIALRNSLKQLPPLREKLSEGESALLQSLSQRITPLPEVTELAESAIAPDPPTTLTEGGIIRDGYNAELDELRQTASKGKKWIAEFESREMERAGIQSLKVGYNKVFGYYIEVTNAHREKVPDNYIRKQTLKNSERYITPELKEWESQVLTAGEKARELEYNLFQEVREAISQYTEQLQQVSQAIATLDVLLSFATVSVQQGYIRPEITETVELSIEEGRHPVLDQIMSEEFVPNGVNMDGNENSVLIITGPNMAGKSVYIRQTALLVLMAQMGCFIPAHKATIGIVDRIFTRVGASDEQRRGQSTFMVEMVEVANILNNATPRSLIILDEVGRGTSTFDGVSIAWATAEHIHNKVRARTLFATHYHELAQLSKSLPRVQNLNVAVREWQGEVIFLHRIVPGHADESYGIHVAKIAGVPEEVVHRAREILNHLEENTIGPDDRATFAPETKARETANKVIQKPLFQPLEDKIREKLLQVNVEETTPIEALQILNELVEKIRGKEKK
jgi:DNA mismatch repair protein MutS